MATLYEYFNTGDDDFFAVRGSTWIAQTFTPSTAHKITSVKLLLYRLGSPGTITVSIRATDGSGHPTGGDLCSGTTNGNTLPTSSPYEWREVTLGDGYDLAASTKYAIVVRAPSGDTSNTLRWRDKMTGGYAGGNTETSSNSGSSWTAQSNYDLMFEDWGESAVTAKTSSDTGSGADAKVSGSPVATLIKTETGAGVEALLARMLGLTETGAGLDVVAQAQAILGGAEVGSGADSYISLGKTEAKASSDSGSGVEGTPLSRATLAGGENGSSIDAIIARLLADFDAAYGVEASSVESGLLENLFATELGQGRDALVVRRGIFAGGEGTKFFGGGDKPPHRAS
jgi:hypothetical protein